MACSSFLILCTRPGSQSNFASVIYPRFRRHRFSSAVPKIHLARPRRSVLPSPAFPPEFHLSALRAWVTTWDLAVVHAGVKIFLSSLCTPSRSCLHRNRTRKRLKFRSPTIVLSVAEQVLRAQHWIPMLNRESSTPAITNSPQGPWAPSKDQCNSWVFSGAHEPQKSAGSSTLAGAGPEYLKTDKTVRYMSVISVSIVAWPR